MDFPSYVPEGARSHAVHFLSHYEPALVECEKDLSEIEEKINYWLHSKQDTDYAEIQLTELRRCKTEKTKYKDDLARDIANIKRLVHDDRIKEAYRVLTNAFFDDEESEKHRKFDAFIYAAWSARLDFSPYRERLKQAAELRNEIAKTADKLADLLDQIGETGVICPSEFFSIPELLRNTDNHERDGYNLFIWQAMRGHVLGDPPKRARTESEQAEIDSMEKPKIVIKFVEMDEKPDIDPSEQARDTLRYGWEKSPPLSSLLKTVSKTANEFNPHETGVIGAAIDSRKENAKTEYLRAFGNLLIEQHHFILTTDIMKAMAIAADVVINPSDVVINSYHIDVTYDDVRKALAKWR